MNESNEQASSHTPTLSSLQGTALRGRYLIAVQDTLTQEQTQYAVPNLVTQQGRDSYAALSIPELLASCQLGVGQLPVSDEQTKLSASIGSPAQAGSITVQSSTDSDTLLVQYTFPEGAFDNADLAEVGVFDKNGKLFSRALFKNGQGNLEPITVQKTQRVVVTYSLQLIRPEAPIEAQLMVPNMGNVLEAHTLRVLPQARARYSKSGSVLNEFGPNPASLNQCSVTVITDPNYQGVPGTVNSADREVLPAPALVLEPYLAGSSSRKFAARIDAQYGNKPSGITGIEVTHPVLGVMLTATVQPSVVKTADFRFYFDLSLDW